MNILSRTALFVVIFGAMFLALFTFTFADTTCPPGSAPATAADVPLMTQAGIPNAVVGMCWNRNDTNVGQTDAEAKKYLRSIICPNGSYGGLGADGTIQGLDAKFSVCAAAFLKAAIQGGAVCINEGARSVATQEAYAQKYRSGGPIACVKGALCEHPRGIAIDVNVVPRSGDCAAYQRLFTLAPQFGLTFYLGCKDKVHFVPQKGGCSAGGNVPQDGTIPPTYYDFPQEVAPTSPASSFTNGLRQALGMNQPPLPPQPMLPPQPTPPPQPTLPAQPGATGSNGQSCTPQYSCSNNTLSYQSVSCTTQVVQTCAYGCVGTVCATSAQTAASTTQVSTTLPLPNITNNNTNTNVNGGTSTIDLIGAFASFGNATTTTIGTAVSVVLNADTGNISHFQAAAPGTTSTNISPGMVATIQPVNSQQTFTSNDLGGGGGNVTSSFNSQQSTFAQNVLSSLKEALVWALNYLRPFGSTTPSQTVYAE